jgi:hypothetical protein
MYRKFDVTENLLFARYFFFEGVNTAKEWHLAIPTTQNPRRGSPAPAVASSLPEHCRLRGAWPPAAQPTRLRRRHGNTDTRDRARRHVGDRRAGEARSPLLFSCCALPQLTCTIVQKQHPGLFPRLALRSPWLHANKSQIHSAWTHTHTRHGGKRTVVPLARHGKQHRRKIGDVRPGHAAAACQHCRAYVRC